MDSLKTQLEEQLKAFSRLKEDRHQIEKEAERLSGELIMSDKKYE